ncbi:MAG: tRNA (guanosine(37)-N1)-methyltransferase TrmD [Candidatus Paceibacterota bacterium]|jgi:tRNA (guanine37-N1)-methyltransferase
MQFNIITIFPNIFDSYLKESFIKKAQDKKLIKINIHNLRDWSDNPRKVVDDRPYGGGLGMVLKIEPIYKAIQDIKKPFDKLRAGKTKEDTKVIVFSPRGKKFNQKKATELSQYKNIIMICGRYEGIDERVIKNLADETLSIGNYDLMGGELPAMVVIETVSRLIPNVLGKPEFLKERMTDTGGFMEYPQYTRPEVFILKNGDQWKVPKVLISGDQKKITTWKNKKGKVIEK